MSMRRVWWFVLVAVVVACGMFLWIRRDSRPLITAKPQISIEALRATWVMHVSSTLADYERTKNAAVARDQLLTLIVPSEWRETHLRLVLAFQSLTDQKKNANSLLSQAIKAYQRQIK